MFGRLYLQKMKSLILEVFALIINEAMTIESRQDSVETKLSSNEGYLQRGRK